MNKSIEELAGYCLNCPTKPCSKNGCPLSNDIPTFIKQVKEEKWEDAYQTLLNTTVLGSVCGRICPHQKQCQGSCVRGIKAEPVNIGKLESYVFDKAIQKGYDGNRKKGTLLCGKKIAIVGGGPAGLTASHFLAREGASVTIYEKYERLGGILSHGIPEFRLEPEVLEKTIASILRIGIQVKYKQELGKNLTIEELRENYDAVFLAFGANIPRTMGIEGEDLEGVYGGNTLLELGNHPNYEGKQVAIIGGGNVAMDCARTIQKKGAKQVVVIYRRSKEEMPAEEKEIEDAQKEGVQFLFQTNIKKILGKKQVEQIECIQTELIQKEGETRKVPVDIENSNTLMKMDYVIMAVGSKVEGTLLESQKLATNQKKYLQVEENHQIQGTNIFAGGDLIGTTSTVAWAAKDGRETAEEIKKYLKKLDENKR